MTTEPKPVLKPDFVLTQKERDALEYVRSIPYRQDGSYNFDLSARVVIFLTACSDMGQRMQASADADNLIHLCYLDGDYSRLDAIIPEQKAIIAAAFARAEFDCEKVD